MDFVKSFEKILKSKTFFIIIALVVLFIGFNCYSNNKSSLLSGFTTINNSPSPNKNTVNQQQQQPVKGMSNSSELGAPISGIAGTTVSTSNCTSRTISDPADLLPKDTNSDWAQLNPNGAGDLQNISLLKAGHHVGINTTGSNLRNANLQIRSEPPIQKSNVGPWLNSTIEPDCLRKSLELGPSTC